MQTEENGSVYAPVNEVLFHIEVIYHVAHTGYTVQGCVGDSYMESCLVLYGLVHVCAERRTILNREGYSLFSALMCNDVSHTAIYMLGVT